LRNSRVSNLPAEIPPAPIAAQTNVSTPPPAQAVVESPPVEVVNDNHSRTVPNRARLAIRQPRTDPAWNASAGQNAESKAAPEVVTPLFESPKPAPPAAVKTNPNTDLSPRVIAPPKSAPPKGKVIQWP